MGEFLTVCPKRVCISTVGIRRDLYPKDPFQVPITNFFGSVRPTEITSGVVNITLTSIPEDVESPVVQKILHGQSYSDFKIQFQEQFPTKLFQ